MEKPPRVYRVERDDKGRLLCPACGGSTFQNFTREGKRIHWHHQCRVCEARFEEVNEPATH